MTLQSQERKRIVWPDNSFFFLTNSTYLHYPCFKENEQKQLVLNFFKKLQKEWKVPIQCFSIPMTHHHLMFYGDRGEKVTFTKRFLKNNISREYRRSYSMPYEEFWHSTRVYWVKHNNMYWRVTGYINGNLLKHKEVSTFKELYEYPFSSFKYLVDKYGWDEAKRTVMAVIKVPEDSYGAVDFDGLTKIKVLRPS